MAEIKEHEWFKQGYSPATPDDDDEDEEEENTTCVDDAILSVQEVMNEKLILYFSSVNP